MQKNNGMLAAIEHMLAEIEKIPTARENHKPAKVYKTTQEELQAERAAHIETQRELDEVISFAKEVIVSLHSELSTLQGSVKMKGANKETLKEYIRRMIKI